MYYSGLEIIEMALRVEENGYKFYTEAQKITDDLEIKALFLNLAAMEVNHVSAFKKMLENYEPENFEFNKDESEEYINFLADSHIFSKKNAGIDKLNSLKSGKDALEMAFKFEIDSIAFYKEISGYAQKEALPVIERLIEEEKQHAKAIKKLMK